MAQTNKRSSSGKKKRTAAKRRPAARGKKRSINLAVFAGLGIVLILLLACGIVLLARDDTPDAEEPSTSSADTPAEHTEPSNQEGTTMAQTTTTTTTTAQTDPSVTDDSTAQTGGSTTTAADTATTSCTTTTTAAAAPSASGVEPTYIQGILVVNKTYALPSTYAPGDLEPIVKSQFAVMQKDAAALGLNLYISSGYRSYDYQKRIYNNNVAAYGVEKTDTFSARPGHSEHQTGLAFDLNTINDAFALTPESDWVKEHAHEYGFIVRYPEGKSDITGYKYEPWHLRYLGVDTATAVYQSGLTLEEYLGIDSAYAD